MRPKTNQERFWRSPGWAAAGALGSSFMARVLGGGGLSLLSYSSGWLASLLRTQCFACAAAGPVLKRCTRDHTTHWGNRAVPAGNGAAHGRAEGVGRRGAGRRAVAIRRRAYPRAPDRIGRATRKVRPLTECD